MHNNIDELSHFYQSKLGKLVINCVVKCLQDNWGSIETLDTLGFGYASPFLEAANLNSNRLVNFIPNEIGIERWPINKPNQTIIGDENNMPFFDDCFDRAVCFHTIEGAQNPRALLREFWRIMKPEGEIIFFVTNRRSAWAQWDITPFGHGRPYSKSQINKLLDNSLFEITSTKRLLALPPFELGLSPKYAAIWEKVGTNLWPGLNGLIAISAKKRLFRGVLGDAVPAKGAFSPLRANFLNNHNQ